MWWRAPTHYGRRLIVVVLGAPTAKSRNQEAADLFDRGFAIGGGERLAGIAAVSGVRPAPNMRADVCLRRNAAAIAAAEDEGVAEPIQVGWRPRAAGARSPTRSRRCSRRAHTELSDERIHFDPVPVFLGPPRAGRVRRSAPVRPARRRRPTTLKANRRRRAPTGLTA